MILSYKVTVNDNQKTIKTILKTEFNMSDRLILKVKTNQKIICNKIPVWVNHIVKEDDLIEVYIDFEETSENIISANIELNIIYEDEFYLILNKSAGIPVHPTAYHYDNTLSNGVKYYFDSIKLDKKIRPVNRLDKDTSGLVVFAKNSYIQECLIKQMKNNIFKKNYIAVLDGILEKENGIIELPISRKQGSIIERCISEDGDYALTNYKIISKNKNYTICEVNTQTGRTHQIRVHFQSLGYPLLGDTLYGRESNLISRQALHAYRLNFIHPVNKVPVEYTAELPQDMKKLTC